MEIFTGFGETVFSVVKAVLPLSVFFVIFQFSLLKLPRSYFLGILKGTLIASCGLLLFLQGITIGFLPFGRLVGAHLGTFSHHSLLIFFGVLFGFAATWGEPAVRILADQVEETSSGSIPKSVVLYAICLGVSVFVGLGMARIAFGFSLLKILVPGYILVTAMMWFSDREFLSIAIDAGGVATGPIANTFLLALALGTSASMGRQDPMVSGLGFVALIALAAILSVLVTGFIFRFPIKRKES